MKIFKSSGPGRLLFESTSTAEIPASIEAIRKYALSFRNYTGAELSTFKVTASNDNSGERIGWNNLFVISYASSLQARTVVFGMCDQPISEEVL